MQLESVALQLSDEELQSDQISPLRREAVKRGVPLKHIIREALIEKSRAIKKASEATVPDPISAQ